MSMDTFLCFYDPDSRGVNSQTSVRISMQKIKQLAYYDVFHTLFKVTECWSLFYSS